MQNAEWVSTGLKLMGEQRLAEAVAAFDRELRHCPDNPTVHYLRGEALFLLRRLDEALNAHAAATRLAMRAGADRGAAMSGLVPGDFGWMSHMLRGDFESAWRLADADRDRRRRAGITGADWPRHMRPVWDGAALAGARVLVRCYHGLGDTIQFARYLPLLAERAALVRVEAQPELIPLLRSVPGNVDFVALGDRDHPPARFGCDAEIDITELPHAFRTTLGTIPAAIPYLSVERGAVARGSAASLRGVGTGARRACLGRRGLEAGALGSARPARAARRNSRHRTRQSAARPGISKLARDARPVADDRGVR